MQIKVHIVNMLRFFARYRLYGRRLFHVAFISRVTLPLLVISEVASFDHLSVVIAAAASILAKLLFWSIVQKHLSACGILAHAQFPEVVTLRQGCIQETKFEKLIKWARMETKRPYSWSKRVCCSDNHPFCRCCNFVQKNNIRAVFTC